MGVGAVLALHSSRKLHTVCNLNPNSYVIVAILHRISVTKTAQIHVEYASAAHKWNFSKSFLTLCGMNFINATAQQLAVVMENALGEE